MRKRLTDCGAALLPPLLLLALERVSEGSVGRLMQDAQLYLSIADNALASGHFIQTVRPYAGFVVPPGFPLCLLLLRVLGFGLAGLIAAQAVLFGLSCLLLARTGRDLLGPWGLSVPFFYLLACLRCRLYLGSLSVEHWYLFLLCALVRLLFRNERSPRRLVLLHLASLALLLTRPALAPVFLAVLVCTLAVCLREKRFALGALLLLLPAVLLGLNLLVNHRETGEWVLLQNYGVTDLYRAAAPGTALTRAQADTFNDPFLNDVMADASLSMSAKSRVLSEKAGTYIRSDPLLFFRNGLARCCRLFLAEYAFLPLLALPGAVLLARGPKRRETLGSLALALLTVFISGFGVPELRYTMPIWPLASLHLAALCAALARLVPGRNCHER